MTTTFPNLFSPFTVGSLTLKNRVVAAPIYCGNFATLPFLSDVLFQNMSTKAKGGCAQITVGETPVDFEYANREPFHRSTTPTTTIRFSMPWKKLSTSSRPMAPWPQSSLALRKIEAADPGAQAANRAHEFHPHGRRRGRGHGRSADAVGLRQLRHLRQIHARHRFRRRHDPCRPWLAVASVPVSPHQPANGCLRRLAGKPRALSAARH